LSAAHAQAESPRAIAALGAVLCGLSALCSWTAYLLTEQSCQYAAKERAGTAYCKALGLPGDWTGQSSPLVEAAVYGLPTFLVLIGTVVAARRATAQPLLIGAILCAVAVAASLALGVTST
jgi:hypothetical protein